MQIAKNLFDWPHRQEIDIFNIIFQCIRKFSKFYNENGVRK